MRVRMIGVNKVTTPLADGTRKTTYYAWRGPGAPILVGEPGTPEFAASYMAAMATRKPDAGTKTLAWLIHEYTNSSMFIRLGARTKSDYQKHLVKIEDKFGELPLKASGDPRTSDALLEWRDELAVNSPRQADYTWSVMQAVFTFGQKRKREFVKVNPCDGQERLYTGSRVEKIWESPQIAAFLLQRKYAHMHLPLLIALWTGLHQADICRLTWSAYDGEFIRWKQSKSIGAERKTKYLIIPVGAPLREVLDKELAARDAILRTSAVRPIDIEAAVAVSPIVLNSEGNAWTAGKGGYNGFRSSFAKACMEAGVKGVAFTDLRGTAVTRLAIAGATIPEICQITGHTHGEANAILEAHYLHKDPAIALAAIRKYEVYWFGRDEAPTAAVATVTPVVPKGRPRRAAGSAGAT